MELTLEGRVLIGDQLVKCCIGVKDGKIVEIKKIMRWEEHLDFKDMLILPGGVDIHVHMREPGLTAKEDFSSGTKAAAFGGITCVMDMPNTIPPTTTIRAVEDKLDIASRKAWVDFGIFAGCTPGVDPTRLDKGVVGYKLYMGSTTGDLLVTEDDDIKKVLESIKESGSVLSVHAEDQAWLRNEPTWDLEGHASNRPYQAETAAIERLSSFSQYEKINICHISSKQGLELLSNLPFTKEVTPHHLLLSSKKDLGAMGKANPPLRSEANRKELFEAFKEGSFDILASDHAPHTFAEKEDEFDYAPSGIPGVETSLPLMLLLVKKGIIDLPMLVRMASYRPALLFNLNKGYIDVGMDADLMVVDPRIVSTIKGDRLHSRCGWTPYEGWESIFPYSVMVRGRMVVDEGVFMGERVGRNVVGV
ncbi:MAG: amidohydrolase family protein [Methanomassiliicoccales archaeon]|nr:amidohydrolase family protein [Methanomassiliicoccales archaeon]